MSNHLPSQNVSGQQTQQFPPFPPQSSRREGVFCQRRFQVRAWPLRRDAQMCNKGVVLSRPTATRSDARARTGYVLIRNNT